jgi:hypothetical protein
MAVRIGLGLRPRSTTIRLSASAKRVGHVGGCRSRPTGYARRMSAPLDNPDARRLFLQAGIVCNLGQASKIIDELSPLLAAEGIDLHRPSPLDPVASLFAVAASLAALAEHDGVNMDDVISGMVEGRI